MVYTTFHFPESGANVITTENSDWATNCPEYKVTAVQATRVTQPSEWQKRFREFSETSGSAVEERERRRRGRQVARDMSGEGHGGNAEHLVQMANDIGNFFRSEPERKDAIAGIANHIAKFWTPRMREKLNAHLKAHGADGLDELPPRGAAKPRREPVGQAARRSAGRRCGLNGAWRRLMLRQGFDVRDGAASERG